MNEEPLVAQLVTPQPSSKAKAGCAILGCLSVCLLLVALVIGGASYGIYQVVKVANEASARQRAAEESLQAELAGQASAAPGRSAEIVAAFSADDPGVPAEELAALQAIFDKAYEQREQSVKSNQLNDLLDFDAFTKRFSAWPESKSLDYLERQGAVEEFRDSAPLSWLIDKFTIVHVAKRDDGKSAIVTGYVGLESGTHMEQRWLLVAHGSGWRIADSEICDWGCWRTQLQARHMKAANAASVSWQRFDAALDSLSRANDLLKAGKSAEAVLVLEQLDYALIEGMLQDEVRMRLLQALNQLDVPEKRLAIARQFQHPEHWPGAVYAITESEAALGNCQAAVDAGRQYMDRVGPTIGINELLLPCYEQLEDEAAQAQTYRHLLRVKPGQVAWLAGLAKTAPDEVAEVIERLQKLPEPAKTASEVVQYLSVDDHQAAIIALLAFLEREAAGTLPLLETKARLAYQKEKYDEAASIYLDAWKAHRDDKEAASGLCAAYFEAMIAADQTEAAFDRAPDAEAALHFLASDYFFYQEYGVSKQQIRAALEKYRGQQGEDTNVRAYEGKLLLEDKRYAEAERQLRAALEQLSAKEAGNAEEESNGLDRDDLLYSLASALLMQGQVEKAHETASAEVENAAWRLFSKLQLDNEQHREHAKQLITLQRIGKPADPWTGVMQATLLEAEQKPAEAWAALPKTLPEDDYLLWSIRSLAEKP